MLRKQQACAFASRIFTFFFSICSLHLLALKYGIEVVQPLPQSLRLGGNVAMWPRLLSPRPRLLPASQLPRSLSRPDHVTSVNSLLPEDAPNGIHHRKSEPGSVYGGNESGAHIHMDRTVQYCTE